MATSWRGWSWQLGLVSSLAIGGVPILGDCAFAQITRDTTLGPESSSVTRNVVIKDLPSDRIEGGAKRGANLFHSFQEFNIKEGRGGYFTNPAGIENILSRVTGTNTSNILGTLGVFGGTANLFLINPNGIIFGPNARLDVNGSFVGTTANGVRLANGDSFSTNPGDPLPTGLLNVNPNAFLFNQLVTEPTIQNQSRSGLEVDPGRSLLLLGGDVSLDGGILQAPGGRVELGGVAEARTIGLAVDGNNLDLSFPTNDVLRADISLTNGALVNVTAGGSGSITINARNLEVLGESRLVAGNIGRELGAIGLGSQTGDITLNTTGVTRVGQSSSIENWVNSDVTGNGGDINIKAGSLLLTDSAALDTRNVGQGDSGNISMLVDGNISLAVAEIINDTYGQGNSGNISVQAGGDASLTDTHIYSFTFGQGDSGNISVQAGGDASLANTEIIRQGASGNILLLADGDASLTDPYISNIASGGDAGDILVQAGGNVSTESFIINAGTALFAEGNAGSISVQADGNVSFAGGSIGTATYGQGDVGSVSVQANGNVSTKGFFILSDSFGDGDGGNISVQADGNISLAGGDIRASTYGDGDGGNISVQADGNISLANRQIEGVEVIFTDRLSSVYFTNSSISSNVQPGAEGEGGDIYVQARSLDINYGFRLSAVTYGKGIAGNIRVEALDSVALSGINPQYGFSSGLFTNTEEGASRQGMI